MPNSGGCGFSYIETSGMSDSIYSAKSVHLSTVVQLLAENDLPIADLTQSSIRNFLGLYRDESIADFDGQEYDDLLQDRQAKSMW